MTKEKDYDVKLSDGKEIKFDFFAVTHKQHCDLMATRYSDEEINELLSPVVGIPADDLANLPYADWKRIVDGYIVGSAQPYKDLN